MLDHYSLVQQLTTQALSKADQPRRLNDFADELGWRPSNRMDLPEADEFAAAHLVVEHGLQNTAVISFLRQPATFPDLTTSQQKVLLNASYNNLVDWHINIDFDGVSFVYNRFKPPQFHIHRDRISRTNIACLSSGAFEKLSVSHPSPNVPALDNALIETISLWKRQLGSEVPGVSNESLSALFNAIIFARAAEDQARKTKNQAEGSTDSGGHLSKLFTGATGEMTLRRLFEKALRDLTTGEIPASLVDLEALAVFDKLDPLTASELLGDFYRNRYARYYEYDFSLMSKHALSRIYEHYVSVLRLPQTHQTTLFPMLAEERVERSYGNVYTPEFVARFFAKYLRRQLPLGSFQRLKVADPACGSGIFLRTVLELQHEVLFDSLTTESLKRMFQNVLGLDVDPNACQAARLSLSLLAMVLMDKLPGELQILNEESIGYFQEHPELAGSIDAVIANPPFVTVEDQGAELKERVNRLLGGAGKGRVDLYLAMLRLSMEMLKPGGFGLFVLPQNFLLAESAAGMRRYLAEGAWVHCLADLSAVPVFGDIGVYVILLIIQKLPEPTQLAPNAIVVRAQDMVGQALQDVLEGRKIESPYYSIYEVGQEAFREGAWLVLPPQSAAIQRKFSEFAELQSFTQLRQGIITGADDIFLLPSREIPKDEAAIYIPFLADRDMEAYTVPKSYARSFFYPYLNGEPLDEGILCKKFPKTWKYLVSHRAELERRKTVASKRVAWWRPAWPREPQNLLHPKLVTPHLVISPRFALDATGRLAVSHSPIVLAKSRDVEHDHLRFILAVLNSSACFWYISEHSHSYQHGYSRLEAKTLGVTRIPNPLKVDPIVLRRLVRLVDERLEAAGPKAFSIEGEIDEIVADLYSLTASERRLVGMKERP
jgi:type I restriction-modification system DNA methylase subunit